MLVKDVMTKDVITITPETSFSEAMKILRENKIRRLPVLKGDKIVGIVTEKDILSASPSSATSLDIWELQYLLNKLKIKEIMTKNVITVGENTPIEDAARLLEENKIGALPVVNDEGKLSGIITETDIFKVFVKMLGSTKSGIRYTFEVVDRPGVIFEIAQRINQSGGNIISVSTYPLSEDRYLVMVKTHSINHDSFVEALKELKDVKLLYHHQS